jgi:nucleotide-binding universal stress UspA family protein
LNQLASELVAAGFMVESSISPGFFDKEVIAKANELNPDFLLMFTHGSHSMIEDLFGTKTSGVFEKIKCPMLVIPEDHDVQQIKKVAVGIHIDEDKNFEIMKDLFALADEMHLELSFIKIDNNYQLDPIEDSAVLTRLQKTYPGRVNYVVHRKAENLAKGLQEYAKELNADLTVLFTTRKTFIEKLFHKSVTRDLILHSKTPLLIYHY